MVVQQSPLGKAASYQAHYDPSLLFAVPRQLQRAEIQVIDKLPFQGGDLWTAYEISWLNKKGKPEVALAEFYFPCETPNLIESKSFKLYLNSYNQTSFTDIATVTKQIQTDLSKVAGATVSVTLIPLDQLTNSSIANFTGICLDTLDIAIDTYTTQPNFLQVQDQHASETFYTHLFKSNCLVTGQPDWASLQISYTGPQIDQAGLLKYLISFRQHNEFHEHCVERIFIDLMRNCQCQQLSVYARFTRRGGLDINPFRSTHLAAPPIMQRLARQ